MNRRELLLSGAMAGVAFVSECVFAQSEGTKIIPWIDQPVAIPPPLQNVIKGLTPWEDLDSQITPNNKFFSIAHYNRPQIDAKTWQLDISGQVNNPTTMTLDRLKAMPHEEVIFTLECSGNNGLPFFQSGVGNARWGGTSLAQVLKAAQIRTTRSKSYSLVPIKGRRWCIRRHLWNTNSPPTLRAACRSSTQ
jgi:DMSO/TMAO reductase YedYZ molybdopterin-dependent catalytic subunit